MTVCLVLLLFTLCGCKSQAVKDTEQAIDAIGEVSLDSEYALTHAESLYSMLTDKEKESVDNRTALVNARDTFEYLVAKEQKEIVKRQGQELNAALFEVNDAVSFLGKYVQNVRGTKNKGISDNILGPLYTGLSDVELDALETALPGITDDVAVIRENCLTIRTMCQEMGRTGNLSNLDRIQNLALETEGLILALTSGDLSKYS